MSMMGGMVLGFEGCADWANKPVGMENTRKGM
jgi:hypothetical protein